MQSHPRVSPIPKILLFVCLVLLLSIAPKSFSVESGLRRARIAQEWGYWEAAADGLRQAVEREPWRKGLWEELGRAEYYAGRSAEALDALRTAAQQDALSPQGRFLMGEVSLSMGDAEAADAAWLAVIGYACEDGSQGVDNDLLGRAYERLTALRSSRSDFEGATRILSDWYGSRASDAQAAYRYGLHLSATTPEEAEPVLIEAAGRDAVYSDRVQVLRSGLALYAVAEQPAYGWLMVGRSLASVDEWQLAERTFRQAVELEPEYAEAWAFLSEARTHTGGSGQPEMERALALAPRSPVVNALHALGLRRQGRYADALVYLQAVTEQEPDEPFWLVETANTLVAQGDLMVARDYYQKAAELEPANPTYWLALAMFSVDYNYDIRGVGIPAARQAVLLAPESAAALDGMGWALANLDDAATGERFLQQALAADPTYSPANLHLAQIYLNRQQSGEAYDYLKQAAAQTGAGGSLEAAASETARRLLEQYFNEDW